MALEPNSLDLCSFLSFFDQARISTNFALNILAEIFLNSILVNLLLYPKKQYSVPITEARYPGY